MLLLSILSIFALCVADYHSTKPPSSVFPARHKYFHDFNTDHMNHIVFFGDSLMRYQYLAYVYKLHFFTTAVPGYMINEKLYASWNDFFYNTTIVFNDAMKCDCFREASGESKYE